VTGNCQLTKHPTQPQTTATLTMPSHMPIPHPHTQPTSLAPPMLLPLLPATASLCVPDSPHDPSILPIFVWCPCPFSKIEKMNTYKKQFIFCHPFAGPPTCWPAPTYNTSSGACGWAGGKQVAGRQAGGWAI
jgi:hypothetical protein